MKKDKKLKEYADNSLSKWDNQEFLQSLQAKIQQEQPKKRMTSKTKHMIFAFASCLVIFIVIISCFSIFFLPLSKTSPSTPSDDNEQGGSNPPPLPPLPDNDGYYAKISSIDELNSHIDITLKDISTFDNLLIKKWYDNDDTLLFFTIYFELDGNSPVSIVIVTNNSFDFDSDNPVELSDNHTTSNKIDFSYDDDYQQTADISDFALTYNDGITQELYVARGKMLTNSQKLYIAYDTQATSQNADILQIMNMILAN